MENQIAKMLDEEIMKTLKDVSGVQAGSEQAKALLIKLEKLMHERTAEQEASLKSRQLTDNSYLKSEENDIRMKELEQRTKQAELDLEMKQAELEQKDAELREAKTARRWKTALEVLGITLPVGVSSYWMLRGLQFEEEGKVFTSRAGQWLSGHLRLFGKKG